MAEIKININNVLNDISPMLYGVFFEDINYAGDGGLYAELVANRSFEYYDRDGITEKSRMCWEELKGTRFNISTAKPLNGVHTHYASVSGGSGCGIRNSGFCGEGFAVKGGDMFVLSVYIRAAAGLKVKAVIADRMGNVCGSSDIVCSGSGWNRYETEILTEKDCGSAYLSIVLPHGGSADIEFVSLFPKNTFKGRRNGMRRDIAEKIAEMKPKFMRFPGGCIVEGRSFENMYNWKDTVGPVEKRRTNWNRWQSEEYRNLGFDASDYYQSYGIGFFEYFQFCEDIGAKPVPVVNCGMTCQWHEGLLAELDELDTYIEDVLDLIEFANGDTDSVWGRVRAQMGHPEPFGLEYIGIGNEQWGKEYFERYEMFEREISRVYPDIKLITSAGWKDRGWEYDTAYEWMRSNKEKAFAVDEHFYKEPEWFLDNIDRYNDYDRSLPKVFVGEWAAHTSTDIRARKNNWYAALAEAAFLTGVEKNADHVIMSCYAPLLARYDHQQWQPNLIWFSKDKVYCTPSYYVQKLFSENVGEHIVESVCDDADIKQCVSVRDGNLIIKLVNLSEQAKGIKIDTDAKFINVTEIKAAPEDENTFDMSEKVYPTVYETETSNGYDMPPYSVAVLKIGI